jgi:hypothetical protein
VFATHHTTRVGSALSADWMRPSPRTKLYRRQSSRKELRRLKIEDEADGLIDGLLLQVAGAALRDVSSGARAFIEACRAPVTGPLGPRERSGRRGLNKEEKNGSRE